MPHQPLGSDPQVKDNIVTTSRGLHGLKISSNIFCGIMMNYILVSEAVMASLACKMARTLPKTPTRMLGAAVSGLE